MQGSIRRRGKNSWEITVDAGRDAQGKRARKFLSLKGKRADAERKLRELLTGLDRGIPVNSEKGTVAQWLARWHAEYVIPTTRLTTRERYERIIKNHIVPHLGHIQLTKLSPPDIRAMEASLIQGGMAPKGVSLVHTVLSSSLKYGLRMEVLFRNAAQAVSPPKVIRKEVDPPDIAEVRAILSRAKEEGHPLYPALHLIAYTGNRRGEALGLRWQDMDLDSGTISIVQSLSRSATEGLIFQPPKTNSARRTVDLDEMTIAILREHRGQQLLHKMQLEGAYQDNDLVFADPLGGPLNPMALTRALQSLARKEGVRHIRVHDLRHFHASILLQQHQSPVVVSKRLGHANVSITMDIYSHLLPGWQKEAADLFASAMKDSD